MKIVCSGIIVAAEVQGSAFRSYLILMRKLILLKNLCTTIVSMLLRQGSLLSILFQLQRSTRGKLQFFTKLLPKI